MQETSSAPLLPRLCYELYVMFPQNSYIEALAPDVMVLGGRAFENFKLGNESRTFMMELVPF